MKKTKKNEVKLTLRERLIAKSIEPTFNKLLYACFLQYHKPHIDNLSFEDYQFKILSLLKGEDD